MVLSLLVLQQQPPGLSIVLPLPFLIVFPRANAPSLLQRKNNRVSPSVLHNLADRHPVPYNRLDLLWHWTLTIIILVRLPGHVDIDLAAFAREHLRAQALRAQVNRCAVDLVHQNRRQGAKDLHLKLWRFDHVDRGDEGVDDQGNGRRGVDGDGVCFADDANGGFGAFGY